MVKILEAIVVEGKYDKNTLSQIVDAPIFETSGFSIMKDTALVAFLRQVAHKRGLIIFTDSDGAGFVIRNKIKSAISPKYLKHAYIPDVYGKERRKVTAGKEGKIGVEGMTKEILIECLKRAGATFLGQEAPALTGMTKQDLVELGLSGGKDSSYKREALLKHLNFPLKMSANAMLEALNLLYSKAELEILIQNILLQE